MHNVLLFLALGYVGLGRLLEHIVNGDRSRICRINMLLLLLEVLLEELLKHLLVGLLLGLGHIGASIGCGLGHGREKVVVGARAGCLLLLLLLRVLLLHLLLGHSGLLGLGLGLSLRLGHLGSVCEVLCAVRLSLVERSGNLIKLSTGRLGLRLLLELLGLVDLLLLLLMLLRFLQDGHCAIVLGCRATGSIAKP